MAKRKNYSNDSVQRALENHVHTGVLKSVSCDPALDERRPFLVDSAINAPLSQRLTLDEAHMLCIGLALAERRWKPAAEIADAVHTLLDRQEWSADTLEAIAQVFERAGRPLSGPELEPHLVELLNRPGARYATDDEMCSRCHQDIVHSAVVSMSSIVVDIVDQVFTSSWETIHAGCLRDGDLCLTEPATSTLPKDTLVWIRSTNGGIALVRTAFEWQPSEHGVYVYRHDLTSAAAWYCEKQRLQSLTPVIVYDSSDHGPGCDGPLNCTCTDGDFSVSITDGVATVNEP